MAEAKRRKQQQQHQLGSVRERQTSPNPQVQAMQALMGGEGISRPSDAPNPNKLSEPLRKVAEKITIPTITQGDNFQTSPVSMTSLGSLDTSNGAAMTAATSALPGDANTTQYTDEPAEMGEPASYVNSNSHLGVGGEDANKAFSYPGPPPQESSKAAPSRGMSLPGYGQDSPRSPASAGKRHKCPYCSTDFTRHHNLKSHLLTHSQEKPYVCQTCNARFRRLHDLKRHTKLHTGERPHTCDKCGRRFARGDALARHNKGPGGCAGRRSSQGGDDDFFQDEDGMDGVEYTGDEDGDLDAQDRRVGEPSRKRAHLETAQDPNRNVYRQHSSTYPPPAMQHTRPGDMAPPQVVHPGSPAVSSPAAPSFASNQTLGSSYPPPGQMFQQQGIMTESPKPLSPGQPPDQHRLSVSDPSLSSSLNRNRSPSLTTQFQQAHFGRGGGSNTNNTRTPPASNFSHSQNNNQPQLPPLPSLGGNAAVAQARIGLQASSYPGPSSLQHQVPSQQHHASNPGSLSSHGRSSGSSMRDVLSGNQPSDGTTELWTYVRNLEGRFDAMQREYELRIRSLQDEVFALKQSSQGGGSGGNSYSSDMGGQGGVGGRY
ncbi:hypothetical protein LTR95_003093 [Oleoguttula sp. CCFEE 5521]